MSTIKYRNVAQNSHDRFELNSGEGLITTATIDCWVAMAVSNHFGMAHVAVEALGNFQNIPTVKEQISWFQAFFVPEKTQIFLVGGCDFSYNAKPAEGWTGELSRGDQAFLQNRRALSSQLRDELIKQLTEAGYKVTVLESYENVQRDIQAEPDASVKVTRYPLQQLQDTPDAVQAEEKIYTLKARWRGTDSPSGKDGLSL